MIINIITLLLTIGLLIYFLHRHNNHVFEEFRDWYNALVWVLMSALFFLGSLCGGLLRGYIWIEIDFEKIIVRRIFGVFKSCRIDKIKRIYIKNDVMIIEDDRIVNEPPEILKTLKDVKDYGKSFKNYYVTFSYNEKREEIVKSFWSGEIERVD